MAAAAPDALDAEQRLAVEHRGDTLVEAAVGSGKTTVLVERVRWLHRERGVPLDRIAVLTFTRRAAAEVLLRLRAEGRAAAAAVDAPAAGAGAIGHGWLVGTFHAVARSLLARALPVEELGFTRRFTVLDATARATLLRELIAREDLDIRYVAALDRRLAGLAEGRVRHGRMRRDDDLVRLAERYEAEKRSRDAMDFDDLLHGAAALLPRLAPALRPRHVVVDELQDCDLDQLDLIAALRGGEGPCVWAEGGGRGDEGKEADGAGRGAGPACVFAVGDRQQAIYGWRLADCDAFAACRERFLATTLTLGRNRRSSATLVAAANALACRDPAAAAPPAVILPSRGAGSAIAIVRHYDAASEAAWVAEALVAAIGAGAAPSSLAVLARLRVQLEPVAGALRRRGVPLRLRAADAAAPAALSWLTALLRAGLHGDRASLRLALGDRERGLCQARALSDAALAAPTAEDGAAVRAAVRDRLERLARRSRALDPYLVRRVLDGLDGLALRWPQLAAGRPPTEAAEVAAALAVDLAVIDLLRPTRARAEAELALVMAALRSVCADALARQGAGDAPLVALAAAVDGLGLEPLRAPLGADATPSGEGMDDAAADLGGTGDDGVGVAVLTIHTAKGLEFDRVWLVGCNDGVLPLAGAYRSPAALAEEQRLLFVAATRARDALTIGWQTAPQLPRALGAPSALLRLLPAGLVALDDDVPLAGAAAPGDT